MMPRSSRVAFAALAALHGVILFAGFFAPYGYEVQHRDFPLAAPARVSFKTESGQWTFRPQFAPAGSAKTHPVRFFVYGAEYRVLGFKAHIHLFGAGEPERIFLLGADSFGRDEFSRLLYGGQMSLLCGFLAAAVSLLLGVVLGAIAGYCGGLIDAALMRGTELFLAVPWIYLLFGIRAALPLNVPPRQAFLIIVGILGSVGWPIPARLIRGVVLSVKERRFVTAARGFGASAPYLLWRHILPETLGVIRTQAVLLAPRYVLAEVTLSFLGLGLPEPIPSWGNMLAGAQQVTVLASNWWLLAPAATLVPVVLGFSLISRTAASETV